MNPLLLALLVGCSPDPALAPEPLDPALAAELQGLLDEKREQLQAPGASLAVFLPGEGLWTGSSGLSDVENGVPMHPDERFRIGSITKTFVATVLLQLDEEGRLSIEDPLSAWLPDVPHAAEVSLRQLLDHRACYADYVYEGAFIADLDQPWQPWELLALIEDEPLLCVPGEAYRYSNTHYVLLALVIEAATGSSWTEHVHQRLLEPLDLAASFTPSTEPVDHMSRGYLGYGEDALDVTEAIDPSGPWASGEMVSNGRDLVRWATALYGGELLGPDALSTMCTPTPESIALGEPYGLGCKVEEIEGWLSFGHSGSTQGFQSRLRHASTDEGPIVVVTLLNSFLTEADVVDAAVWALLGERDEPGSSRQ